VAVQEVRWTESGGQLANDYTFLYGNGNANHYSGTSFLIYKGISALKRGGFITARL
jgi:hypothetical protein